MVRAFLALELSEEIRGRLDVVQASLRPCRARMTFVEPANIHITVKFLGDVDDRLLPQVMEAVRSVRFAPFPVTVGAVTVNNIKRPNTVWCPVSDAGMGEKLLSDIETVLTPLGFLRETRRFTPHATLARVKDFDPSLLAALEGHRGESYGGCTISGLKLKKSTLFPRGPVYEDLLVVPW